MCVANEFHKYVRDRKPGDGHGGHDDDEKPLLGHKVPRHHQRDSRPHRREREHYNRHAMKRGEEDCHDKSNDDGDNDNDDEGEHHKRWFRRCVPDHVSHGVATFGKSCFDVAADYEGAEKGQTITYALIGVAKRRSGEGEGVDDDEDEEKDIEDLDLEDNVGVDGFTMHKGRRYYVITK
ncbi:UNVERIFIED_CONTAM: hypothetical protein HDU68_003669, partial [Siphonaria sp. JEL0065]